MSLSFNNLCIEDNAYLNTFQYPSPPPELDMYKVFPSFDKVNCLLEREESHESTELNTSCLPTPHLSPALAHS